MRHWTDEERKQISEVQKASWAKRSRKRKTRERYEKRRQECKNLVNIEQMRSDEDYRNYQRLYHQIWYEQKRSEWNLYTLRKKYEQKSIDELLGLRNKWINQVQNFGKTEKQKFVDLINVVLKDKGYIDEVEEQRKAEIEWHFDEIARHLLAIEESVKK